MSHQLDTHLSSRQIYLNSLTPTIRVSNGEDIFTFDNPVEVPQGVTALVSLESMSFANSAYNIDARNSTLVLGFSTGYTAIVLEPGFYSFMTLVDVLNTKMTSVSVVAEYLPTFGKLRFTGTSSFLGIYKEAGGFSTTALVPIGYNPSLAVESATGGVLTMSLLANLSGLQCVYVNLVNLGCQNLDSRSDSTTTLARIDVNANPSEFVFFVNTHGYKTAVTNRLLQQFHVRLEDQAGSVIDLQNIPYSMTLQVDFMYNKEVRFQPELSDAVKSADEAA